MNMKKYNIKNNKFISIVIINVSALLTLIILLWFIYSLNRSDIEFIEHEKNMIKVEQIQGKIQLYDEVLTMSARMAVVTGDISWEQRYRDAEKKLDNNIAKVKAFFPGIFNKHTEKTKLINEKLIEIENKVLDLVVLGDLKQAESLIFSDEYESYKRDYALSIVSLDKSFDKLMIEKEEKSKSTRSKYLFSTVPIVIVFVFAWICLNIILVRGRVDLSKKEEFLQGILDNAVDGIISINKKGLILSVNPATKKLFGYEAEEMIGENIRMLMPSPYQEKHDEYLENYHKTGQKKVIGIGREVSGQHKDGRIFPIELSVSENKIGETQSFTGIVRDISKQKNAESEINEALNFSDLIMDNIPDLVFVKDSEFRIVQANSKFLSVYPESMRDKVVGHTTFENYDAEEAAKFLEQDRIALEKGFTHTEEEIHFPNGELRILSTTKIRFENYKGEEYILGLGHDITERKKSEEELIKHNKQIKDQKIYYETLIENFNNPAFVIDNNHTVIVWNRACELLTGIKAKEVIGTHDHWKGFYKNKRPCLADMLLDKQYNEIAELYETVTEHPFTNEGRKTQNWCEMPTGNNLYLEIDAAPILDGNGNTLAVIEVLNDLTEKINIYDRLKDQKIYYENLFKYLNVPAFILDNDHKVTMWNKACENMTGAMAEDLIGTRNYRKVIYKEDRPLLADLVLEEDYDDSDLYPVDIEEGMMPNGKRAQNWVEFPLKGEIALYLTFEAGPLYDANGEKIGVIQIMQDISSVKELENSIQQNNDKLTRSNEELERFAYVASHDLQEPLRMVSSYTQLLAKRYKDKLDQDANDYINFAVDGAVRMQSLIQDLLKYSRLNTDEKILTNVDANNLFDYATKNLTIAIEESNTVVTKSDLPLVYGDERKLQQLFQNLIGNAVKYRNMDKQNKVHVSAIELNGGWQFCIEDNGIGIAPEYSEKIFVVFKRLHTLSEYKGTGIGLSLCKRIVEAHDGQIWVESEPGEGSRFIFTLKEKQDQSEFNQLSKAS